MQTATKAKPLPRGLRWRGDTIWADFTHGGRRVRVSTGTADIKLAQQALVQAQAAAINGVPPGSSRGKGTLVAGGQGYTVNRAYERAMRDAWLVDAAETTKSQAASHLRAFDASGILPGSTLIGALDRHRCQSIQRALIESGLRPATVNARMWVLGALLAQAERDGAIEAVPKLPATLSVRGNSRTRFLSREQEQDILGRMQARGEHDLHDLFVLLLDTGFRVFEAVRLTHAQYNETHRTLTVPAEWSKTGRQRVIPIATERLLAVVQRRLKEGRGRLFPVPAGSTDSRYWVGRLSKSWLAFRRSEGLDEGIVLHTTRHTLATRLFSEGKADLRTVMEWMDHSNPETTLGYAKAVAAGLHAAAAGIGTITNSLAAQAQAHVAQDPQSASLAENA